MLLPFFCDWSKWRVKILVVNLHAMSNRGDAAITYVTLAYLRRAFPNAQITLAANHPAEFMDLGAAVVPSFKTWVWSTDEQHRFVWHPLRFVQLVLAVLSLLGWRWTQRLPPGWFGTKRALLHAYIEADLVVGCGGNTLYARHRLALMFWIVCLTHWCATLCGKPLVLLPQTIGPFHSRIHAWGARQAIKQADLIMLRDRASYQLATDTLKLPAERCVVTPDLAIFLADVVGAAPRSLRDGAPIGVSVLDWGVQMPSFRDQDAYEHAVAGAIKGLAAQGHRIVFFAQSDTDVWGEDDNVPAQRVIARLDVATQPAVVGVLTVPRQADSMLQFYGQFRLVIATRLHAAILSLAAGTPVVPIAYTSKSWAFVADADLESVTLDIGTVTGDTLLAAVNSVLNDQVCWQQRITTLIEEKRLQADVVTRLQEIQIRAGA